MTIVRKIIPGIILFLIAGALSGQELNCIININSQKISGTDKKVFETMQNAIYEFVNNRKWSNHTFKTEERIECTILITINDRLSAEEFRGTANIVIRRPVFNSAYNSVLLNTIDKNVQFKYVEFQPLDYSDGTFTSNLTSLLAFYSYTILGFYFDSFSPSGGTIYYEKAQQVVNSAQNTSEPGWKAYESDRNRYWLANDYLNPTNMALRDFSYRYHRLGLDQMYEKVDQARTMCTETLQSIQKLYNDRPNLMGIQVILDAKREEFINIYSDQRVPPMEKTNVVNILKEMDPANATKYMAILESK
jgi:hypothetical protein